MMLLTMLKDSVRTPRINYWKVAAGIGALQLIINAKTWYENSSMADPVLRTRFLNWQFSWLYLAQQLLSLVLVSLFCFLLFNVVYKLAVRKAGLVAFLKVLLPLLVMMGLLDMLINYLFYRDTFNLLLNSSGTYFADLLFGTAVMAITTLIVVKVAVYNDIASTNRELALKNARLELEKQKAEMDLLKAQVNPHFLYNSLNYLYARSLPHSKELSDGILLLSEIMKYAFHHPDTGADGQVLLRDEIGYIRKYLRMSALRFGDAFNVSFEEEGVAGHVKIIPFALFTIVENAVKHADATDAAQPIRLMLAISSRQLVFTGDNKKKPAHALKESTQVGIVNLQGRLTATYGDRYDLQISDLSDRYSIKLSISLTDGD